MNNSNKNIEDSGVKNGVWYKISLYFQAQSNRLTPTRLKICLGLFIAIMGGASLLTCVRSLRTAKYPDTAVLQLSGSASTNKEAIFSGASRTSMQSSFEDILSFEREMDSLRNSENGRALYDSLLRTRPGLFDSIARMERTYRGDIDSTKK